jgi:hypothetical protein
MFIVAPPKGRALIPTTPHIAAGACDVAGDARRAFEVLSGGGIAIVPPRRRTWGSARRIGSEKGTIREHPCPKTKTQVSRP